MGTFSSLQQQKREQSAAPTPSFARPSRSFTPVSSSATESRPQEVSTGSEQAARFGYSFDQIPILPPAKKNTTGLPDTLKAGVEHLSGIPMDDVHVHYHSSKPAQVQALAYTQGTEIHVAPDQEKHLAHEAWHVVQQKQGRVTPTLQAKGVAINDEEELEGEADVMGKKALQMVRANQAAMGAVFGGIKSLRRGVYTSSPSTAATTGSEKAIQRVIANPTAKRITDNMMPPFVTKHILNNVDSAGPLVNMNPFKNGVRKVGGFQANTAEAYKQAMKRFNTPGITAGTTHILEMPTADPQVLVDGQPKPLSVRGAVKKGHTKDGHVELLVEKGWKFTRINNPGPVGDPNANAGQYEAQLEKELSSQRQAKLGYMASGTGHKINHFPVDDNEKHLF